MTNKERIPANNTYQTKKVIVIMNNVQNDKMAIFSGRFNSTPNICTLDCMLVICATNHIPAILHTPKKAAVSNNNTIQNNKTKTPAYNL